MRNHDTFRIRRGPAGIIQRDHLRLGDFGGGELRGGSCQHGLIIGPAGLAAGKRHEMLHPGHLLTNRIHRIEVIRMHTDNAGAAVVQDVGEVGCREAEIDRYNHRPNLRHSVEGLQMRVRVWRDGGNALSSLHPELLQCRRPAVAALKEFAIGKALFSIDHGFTICIKPAGAAGEVEGRERGFHEIWPIIGTHAPQWRAKNMRSLFRQRDDSCHDFAAMVA